MGLAKLPSVKGSYILLIRLTTAQKIKVGALGTLNFPAGFYAYVGSAMGGFDARVRRHLRKEKRLRWHIDYLLEMASLKRVIISPSSKRTECTIARSLRCQFASIPHFGSSDCTCPSHLFYATNQSQLQSGITKALGLLGYPLQFFEDEETKAP